ncbi:hypothetical protein F4821DRAFT_279721 [Hypoxylon rubiginosum]|uniref:Uncharacterized protein n=1 Tax=Hypoxylon rubiginosum TaxID=110542 RepID=A0ACC0CXL8_9PEZI|nr:hypothetical protein F4821DRAFT_279721 [Hypoxylon rubiginosum]
MAGPWPKPSPKLEECPGEIINEITKYLGREDIASLRRTNRHICGKASYRFATYFESKTIDLTPDCLFEFIYLTRVSPLARRLKHLTIQGHVYGNREYRRRMVDKKKYKPFQDFYLFPYLAKALENLRKYSSEEFELTSLSLRVVPVMTIKGTPHVPKEFRSYRSIWDVANRTFSMAMKALWKAQIPVRDHLDIFSNIKGCSLRYDSFIEFAREFATWQVPVFRSLKRLSMSLSLEPDFDMTVYLDDHDRQGRLGAREFIQRSCVRQVIQVIMHGLHFMPELEDVDFHWYNIPERPNEVPSVVPYERVPPYHSGPPLTCTSLKTCTLRGVFISEPDLLQFLRVVRPSTLSLEYICLTAGIWNEIIQYLASPESGITSYRLDDVRKLDKLVHFLIPGETKFSWMRRQLGPSTLKREGDEAKQFVRCGNSVGLAMLNCDKRRRWEFEKRRDFGGFLARYYNFMLWGGLPTPGDTRKIIGGKKGKKGKK